MDEPTRRGRASARNPQGQGRAPSGRWGATGGTRSRTGPYPTPRPVWARVGPGPRPWAEGPFGIPLSAGAWACGLGLWPPHSPDSGAGRQWLRPSAAWARFHGRAPTQRAPLPSCRRCLGHHERAGHRRQGGVGDGADGVDPVPAVWRI